MNLATLLFFVAGALILLEPAQAEDSLTLSGGGVKTPQGAYLSLLSDDGMWNSSGVVFQAKGETILTFTADGKIIPNPKYPPDENAKRFIEAVQRTWPKMCGKKEVRG